VYKGSTTRVGAGRVQKSQGRRWDRPRQLRVHCSERCLAPDPHRMVNVIISVIIGTRPIQQVVVSQSLG
jgi:hypothetical protein